MSDRWPLQLIVYGTTEPAIVRQIINDYGLTENHNDGPLVLGETYLNCETSTDAPDLAEEIIRRAPITAFLCWSDPKYEWLGTGVMYASDLDQYHFASDSDGNPLFRRNQVMEMLTLDKPELEQTLGVPWFNRMQALLAEELAV